MNDITVNNIEELSEENCSMAVKNKQMLKRSPLWSHFIPTKPGLARCNVCLKEFSYKGGSTANLAKHLRAVHSSIAPEKQRKQKAQSRIRTTVQNQKVEKQVEFSVSEKEGMSQIVCDQLVKLISSSCSTNDFLKRLILLQELVELWTNNEEVHLITVEKDCNQTNGGVAEENAAANGTSLPDFSMEGLYINIQPNGVTEEKDKDAENGCETTAEFCCEQCGDLFKTATLLRQHVKIHQGPYKCGNCEKLFTRPEGLKRHMIVHSGVKSYMCSECGKSFARFDHLNLHMRIHTGERPYKCNECGKRFYSGPHLKKHLRVHKRKASPFICNCHGQTFASLDAIQVHLEENVDFAATEIPIS